MRSMRGAHSTDPKRVQAALKSHRFNFLLGEVGFDAKGDISAPGYVLYAWKGGKYEYAN
jgi:branched-chain amino acid transport system substrate-binding protein